MATVCSVWMAEAWKPRQPTLLWGSKGRVARPGWQGQSIRALNQDQCQVAVSCRCSCHVTGVMKFDFFHVSFWEQRLQKIAWRRRERKLELRGLHCRPGMSPTLTADLALSLTLSCEQVDFLLHLASQECTSKKDVVTCRPPCCRSGWAFFWGCTGYLWPFLYGLHPVAFDHLPYRWSNVQQRVNLRGHGWSLLSIQILVYFCVN